MIPDRQFPLRIRRNRKPTAFQGAGGSLLTSRFLKVATGRYTAASTGQTGPCASQPCAQRKSA